MHADESVHSSGETSAAFSTTHRFEPGLSVVVLAGGKDLHARHLCRLLAGGVRPRQLCPLLGDESMMQRALTRAGYLVPVERVYLVASLDYEDEVRNQALAKAGHVLLEPSNRGDAPGLRLGLAPISRANPDDVVAVFPADHFILQEAHFLEHVRRAKQIVDQHPELCVLLVVEADGPETSYGWVQPSTADQTGLYLVHSFLQKPNSRVANSLWQTRKCFFSTQVLVARAQTLTQMLDESLPRVAERLSSATRAYAETHNFEELRAAYAAVPRASVAASILERNPPNLRALLVREVLWCDFGSTERIRRTLAKVGKLDEVRQRLSRAGFEPSAVLGPNCGP